MFNDEFLELIEKELENRKFKHRTWFKQGVNVAYALKYLANGYAILIEKEVKKRGETALFTPNETKLTIKGERSSYTPKDNKELYYFVYHALKFEREQIQEITNDNDIMNKQQLQERFNHIEEFYNRIMNNIEL